MTDPITGCPMSPAVGDMGDAHTPGIIVRNTADTYIELHVSSAFSFLEAASAPESYIERALEINMPAMALTDRNGLYGVARQEVGTPAMPVECACVPPAVISQICGLAKSDDSGMTSPRP